MKYFQLGMVVLTWFARAAADGRITARECVQLVTELISVAGVNLSIDVSDFNQVDDTLSAPPAAMLPAAPWAPDDG